MMIYNTILLKKNETVDYGKMSYGLMVHSPEYGASDMFPLSYCVNENS